MGETRLARVDHPERPHREGDEIARQWRRLFEAFCGVLRGADARVVQGRFGANMQVSLEGDGPVTIVVATDGWAEGDIGRGSK